MGGRLPALALAGAGVLALAAFLSVGDPEVRAETKAEGMAFLDNGLIKIGVDLDRGGSVGYLADVKKGRSVVNVHDLGRYIGQSYYAGPKPFGEPHPGWKDWPWNPVSAGDVYGNTCRLLETRNDGKTLYVKSTPMQWALQGIPADCTFETWITLDGRTAQVRNRLANNRRDRTQYRAMDQELPAAYTIGTLHRLFTYDGDQPFTDGPLTEIPPKPPKANQPEWTSFFATEHWAALVDDHDWGLGVFHPGVYRFLGGFWGKPGSGGPEDDATGYIAPIRHEILDHNIVYEYRYTLILDSLRNIRQYARDDRPKSSLPDYRFERDRQHWRLVNAEDTGYPVQGCLRLKVEKDDPHLIGPEAFWDAADVPKLYIRAAYRTRRREAEVFWATKDKPGFSPEQRVQFRVEPDGGFHTYEVDLSASAAYRGKITGLRLDPVNSGAPGEQVDIAFISCKKE